MGTMLSVAVAAAVIGVPAVVYYEEMPTSDPLAAELRTYSLIPINPPSTLVEVGSLYYVSDDESDFREICAADSGDLRDVVNKSRSVKIDEDLRNMVTLQPFQRRLRVDDQKGDAENKYVQKVHFSLNDIELEEIPLGSNLQISIKLMSQPNCNAAVVEQLNAGATCARGRKSCARARNISSTALPGTNYNRRGRIRREDQRSSESCD